MQILKSAFIVAGMIGVLSSHAFAQATGAPSTTPATTRSAPYVLTVPNGLKMIEVKGHSVLTEPANEAWVKTALEAFAPTTRPSTMPADVLGKLREQKAAMVNMLTTDLALPDSAKVEKFLNETAEPAMAKIAGYHPPMHYLLVPRPKLVELVKGGWSCPRFRYIAAIDDVDIVPAQLDFDTTPGDTIVPVFYAETDSIGQKLDALTRGIDETEANLASLVSDDAINALYVATLRFVVDEGFKPLEFKTGQDWLRQGVGTVLGARCGSMVTGISEAQYIEFASVDRSGNPLRSGSLNLLNPPLLSDVRERALPFYIDAHRRKSARVVQSLVAGAGKEVIAKIVVEVRKNPPADAAALVKLVQQISGIDVTTQLRPSP